MLPKPVTPILHGIIDYMFSGILLAVPPALGLNPKATKMYQLIGSSFLIMNAPTDTPVGVKRVISFRGHQQADATFLATQSLLIFSDFIGKDRRALAFHLSFLSIAIAHYVLTDYTSGSQA